MAIRTLTANPAIAQFQANMLQGSRERELEEEAFRRRVAEERAIAADAGIRNFLEAYYGQPEAGAATPPPAPAAPAIPSAPSVTPSPTTQLAPGDVMPLKTGISSLPASVASPAEAFGGGAAPAPAPAAQPPAAAPAPAAPTRGQRFATGMREMVKTPGTGTAALQLFGREQTMKDADLARQHDGVRLFSEASSSNDVGMMRAISKNYGLGIPDEVLNNREVMAEIAIGMKLANEKGNSDPYRALAFAKGFVHAGGSKNAAAAIQAGLDEAGKVETPFKAAHWAQSPTGEVLAFDASGKMKRTWQEARLPAGAGGGAVGAGGDTTTIKNRKDADERMAKMFPEMAQEIRGYFVLHPDAAITPAMIVKQMNTMREMKNPLTFRPLYKNEEEIYAAAMSTLKKAQEAAFALMGAKAGGGGAARPRAQPAAADPFGIEVGDENDPFGIGAE